jgi:hypothetical protein
MRELPSNVSAHDTKRDPRQRQVGASPEECVLLRTVASSQIRQAERFAVDPSFGSGILSSHMDFCQHFLVTAKNGGRSAFSRCPSVAALADASTTPGRGEVSDALGPGLASTRPAARYSVPQSLEAPAESGSLTR